ncbi:hypothetical protein [Actinocorallia libanotica]|uniref:LPXTG-motif cell wall-anchored protein n=1 Tax=Actinocorallia libanotica TaxID=46162 RepID=A0ABN1S2H9_9ACTN
MTAYTLAVIAILGLAGVVSGGLTLATGADWPTALLAALGLTLTVAGILLQAQRRGRR